MNTSVKKELIWEVFSPQLPSLIEEIDQKITESKSEDSSNQRWLQACVQHYKKHHTLTEEQIKQISALSLDANEGAFELAITFFKTHGLSIDYIVLELIPSLAKQLGKQWEEDTLSFAEVSIGVGKLERSIYKIDYLFQATQLKKRKNKSILISTYPGSQHSLGTLILANYFTYCGWEVQRPIKPTQSILLAEVESKHLQALAISVSTDEQLQELPNLIHSLRERSRNPQIVILIGGSLYNREPEKFYRIQADITAFTPEESVQYLEQHLSRLEKKYLVA